MHAGCSPPWSLRLIGAPAWRIGNAHWHALADIDALLLAMLALEGRQPRTRLAVLLWPQAALPRAHANLRQRLFRLRAQLAGGAVEAPLLDNEHGVELAAAVACDAVAATLAESDGIDWSAPLLAGVVPDDARPALRDWLDDARQRWLARRPELLAARAEREEAAGQLAAAIDNTEQLLVFEPLLEHAWRRLMRLHFLRGDRAAAVRAFERCEAVLRDELGVKPAPETVQLLGQVEQLGPRAARSTLATGQPLPPALRRPPRMVGREAELRALHQAWNEGRAFVVIAEAGLGKSRLLQELMVDLTPQASDAQGREGVIGRTVSVAGLHGDAAIPYATLVRLLNAIVGALNTATGGRDWMPGEPWRPELARLLPELGPPPPSPGLEALLHAAVERALDAARCHGLAEVLVDDLHHADPASSTLLRRLSGSVPLRWGFASRPQADRDWQGWLVSSAGPAVVCVRGLEGDALAALIESLPLPEPWSGAAAQGLAPALDRHCGGNPLFVLETLRHLLLRGVTSTTDRLPLPASVEAALQHRLQAVTPAAQALVHLAAVAEGDFDAELAATVTGSTVFALAAPLAELEAAQLFRGDAFAHDAVFEAARRAVPQVLARALHGRIAEALHSRGAADVRVAFHHAQAAQWLLAARAARQAAHHALRVGRTSERLALWRDAARYAERGGDTAAQFDARVAEIDACMGAEGVDAARAAAAALIDVAATRSHRVAVRLAQASVALAAFDAALTVTAAQAAAAEAFPFSVEALQAQVMLVAGQALAGDVDAAMVLLAAVEPALRELPDATHAAELWSQVALARYRAGDVRACVDALEHQLALARRVGHVETELAALSSLSGQHVALGDTDRAVAQAREAAVLYRRIGAHSSATMSEVNLAIALLGADGLKEAKELLDRSLAFAMQTARGSDLQLAIEDLLAAWWLRVGDAAQALAQIEGAMTVPLSAGRQLSRWTLRAQAAWIDGRSDDMARAWHSARALDLSAADPLQRLCTAALSAQVLDHEDAMASWESLAAEAQARHFPTGLALVLCARIPRLLALQRLDDACQDAQALTELLPRVRHRFVMPTHLHSVCGRAFEAAGRADAAAAARQAGTRHAISLVLPELPSALHDAWLAHPAHAWLGLIPPAAEGRGDETLSAAGAAAPVR